MKILGKLEDWKIRRDFQKRISPGVVAMLDEPTRLQSEKLEKRHFQFVLVNLEDSESDGLPATISKVASTILEEGIPIASIDSSLITVILGVPFHDLDLAESRAKLVAVLMREHGNLIRIAHGHCNGLAGVFGAEKRPVFGAIIPGFSRILKQLLNAQFGVAIEIS